MLSCEPTEHMEAFAMASDFGPRIADLVEVAATRPPELQALTSRHRTGSHRDQATATWLRLVDELAGG